MHLALIVIKSILLLYAFVNIYENEKLYEETVEVIKKKASEQGTRAIKKEAQTSFLITQGKRNLPNGLSDKTCKEQSDGIANKQMRLV